jgi:hypothetical protein
LTPSLPFLEIANRLKKTTCAPVRDIPRMWDNILNTLTALNAQGQLPDLSLLSLFQNRKTTTQLDDQIGQNLATIGRVGRLLPPSSDR